MFSRVKREEEIPVRDFGFVSPARNLETGCDSFSLSTSLEMSQYSKTLKL